RNQSVPICHMLTCTCLLDEFEDDWFTGFCEECKGKIHTKTDALRLAAKNGGFYSQCFCSKRCKSIFLEYHQDSQYEHLSAINQVMDCILDKFPIYPDVEVSDFDNEW